MYTAIVVLLTLALPLGFALAGMARGAGALDALGTAFVFWAVGVRLATAGLRQVLQPRFTAETIFAVTDPRALPLVREIGFANLAIGGLGLATQAVPAWVVPAALVGAVFFALAGAAHLGRRDRRRAETVAMATDLAAAAVLAAVVAGALATPGGYFARS
jgi:hypothetical protein